MANLTFAAQVSDWVRKVKGAEEAVFKESVQELANRVQTTRNAGGRMRVDTGFLRASLMASTSAMPLIDPKKGPVEGQTYAFDAEVIEAVIAGSELGDTIYLGYTAAYAAHREYGARGQAPDAFVRTAAQQWPQIVDEKAAELKSRLGL
jgi:hypothetical protein